MTNVPFCENESDSCCCMCSGVVMCSIVRNAGISATRIPFSIMNGTHHSMKASLSGRQQNKCAVFCSPTLNAPPSLFFSQRRPSEIHKSSEDRWAQGNWCMWYALASVLTSPFHSNVLSRRLLLRNVILHRDFPVAESQVSPAFFNSIMWRVQKEQHLKHGTVFPS